MKMMSIDPGLGGTGFAVWTNKRKVPIDVGVIMAPKKGEWIQRVDFIAACVQSVVEEHRVSVIVCEMMEHYNTAASSMSWTTGDLQRTMMLIGTMHGYCRDVSFHLVTPREWKGQLPKSVIIRRVQRLFGPRVCADLGIKTHAWDAVGIGLYHRGQMK